MLTVATLITTKYAWSTAMSEEQPIPPPQPITTPPPPRQRRRFGCAQVAMIVLAAMLLSAVAAGWWVKHYLYASPYTPTQLSAREQKKLDDKLAKIDQASAAETRREITYSSNDQTRREHTDDVARPERYTEDNAKREIRLSQKELNSLIANNQDMARHVAINLSPDLISLNVVLPLEQDVPILGGKTLRIKCGMMVHIKDGEAVASIRGISLGGVPLPSAWWGDIKNKNLIKEFSGEGGFWDRFSRGVEELQVTDGNLILKLKE